MPCCRLGAGIEMIRERDERFRLARLHFISMTGVDPGFQLTKTRGSAGWRLVEALILPTSELGNADTSARLGRAGRGG